MSNFAHSCKWTIQKLSLSQLEERMYPTKSSKSNKIYALVKISILNNILHNQRCSWQHVKPVFLWPIRKRNTPWHLLPGNIRKNRKHAAPYALKPEKHADWLDAILLRYQVATIYAQFIYGERPVKLTFYYDLL